MTQLKIRLDGDHTLIECKGIMYLLNEMLKDEFCASMYPEGILIEDINPKK